MTTEFTQLDLHPDLVQAVFDLGYVEPTPIQAEIIPLLLQGQDVIGQAQTGTGKTAAYALPILHNLEPERPGVQCLVLAPTRELALQVAGAITQLGRPLHARVAVVYGGAPYGPQISQIRRGAQVVVGTPGRLLDMIRKGILDLGAVHTVVLDEADEMLSMGFIEDMQAILAETPAERQTALFSATLPPAIRRLADSYMHQPRSVTIQKEQVTVAAIEQRYYLVNAEDKLAALARLFEVEEMTQALVFAGTRADTAELAGELANRGFSAELLNGDLSQEARERTLNNFRKNRIQVLVATDVAARGLDIDGISHVINVHLPYDPEVYVHRIGRTGRAGKTGVAISLVAPNEKRLLRQVEAFTHQKVPRASIPSEDEIVARREERLTGQLRIWLQRSRFKRERELVEALVQEGFDPIEIAAAAVKVARGEEKQRPIAPIAEVQETRPASRERGLHAERPIREGREARQPLDLSPERLARRRGNISHEPGMVRMRLSLGKQHGIRPNEIVGLIAGQANIPGTVIGKINIQQNYTLVDVPEEHVGLVLDKTRDAHIRRQALELRVAG